MNDGDSFSVYLSTVRKALEQYRREDTQAAEELSAQARAYAHQRHGCDDIQIEQALERLTAKQKLDDDLLRCFGAWYAYLRLGLVKAGYLPEP